MDIRVCSHGGVNANSSSFTLSRSNLFLPGNDHDRKRIRSEALTNGMKLMGKGAKVFMPRNEQIIALQSHLMDMLTMLLVQNGAD